MSIVKNNLFLILAILICVFAVSALFHPGFFPIHDDEQIARLHELNYDLVSLHIPPRLSQNLGFGYDYPFFNFYPSFAYYFAEIFKLIGFSFILSTKIMIGAGFLLSAVFMYLFSKEYFGKLGGLVSAALYVYAPYHSVDVYVRGAFPESWSFVFIPAIFWSLYRLYKNPSVGNLLLFGLFGASLMLTHNLIALMSVPFIGIYFLYLLYESKNKKNLIFAAGIGGVIAFLISSYFSLPAILENKYTMVNLLTQQLANYNLHFVSLRQFINSPWGYGGSILGPNDGFSLEVGKIHLILVTLAVTLFVYNTYKKKSKSLVLIPFFLLFVLSIFLQSYYSKPVWDALKALSYIQFPWRFMLFAVFSSSFIAGYLFSVKFDGKIKWILGFFIISLIIVFYSGLFHPSKYLTKVDDQDYINQDEIRWRISKMAFEYVPLGIATKKSDLGTTVVDIKNSEIAQNTATPLSMGMMVNVVEDKPQLKILHVTALEKGKLQINTFSFPGWKVFINNKEIRYNDNNKLRLITINVDKGVSVVEARFTDTFIRKLGNAFSVVGIILLFLLLPIYQRKIKL
ncbi:MAG: glycosyltransferase family 39 protein [Patescibacteria group bacterium]